MTAAGVGAFKWGPCVPEIAQPHRYAPNHQLHVAVLVEWSRTIVGWEIMFISPGASGTTKLGGDSLYAAHAGR
jgi:hypothetical protein